MRPLPDFDIPAIERVLLVAGDAARLRVLADRLWASDCIVYCASDIKEALGFLSAELSVSCVLVDPAMGEAFLEELKAALARELPALAIDLSFMPLATRGTAGEAGD